MAERDSSMQIIVTGDTTGFTSSLGSAVQATYAFANATTTAMRTVASGAKPVQDATNAFKDFKREQVQEGRLVGFYVREMTSFTGASQHTQEALGSLTQGVIGLFTATGPLLYAWAGFEIFKSVAGYLKEAGNAAEEAGQKAIKQSAEMVVAITGLNRAIAGLPQMSSAESKYSELLRLRRLAESWDQDASAATNPIDATQSRARAAELWKAYGAMGGDWEMEKLAVEMAKDTAVKVQEAEKKSLADRLTDYRNFLKDRQAAEDAAAADQLSRDIQSGELNMRQFKAEIEDTEKAWKSYWLTVLEGIEARNRLGKSTWDAGEFPDLGDERNKIASAQESGTQRFLLSQDRAAQHMARQWESVATGMGQAFSRGFMAIIAGTQTMADGMKGIFQGILDAFIQMIEEMIAKVITSGFLMLIGELIGGPIGAALGGSAGDILGGLFGSAPRFDTGTWGVSRTGLAVVHQGEAILPTGGPAESFRAGAFGGSTTVNVTFNAPVDKDWWSRNQTHIVDQIRDATRNRRL